MTTEIATVINSRVLSIFLYSVTLSKFKTSNTVVKVRTSEVLPTTAPTRRSPNQLVKLLPCFSLKFAS